MDIQSPTKENLQALDNNTEFTLGGKIFTKVEDDKKGIVAIDEFNSKTIIRFSSDNLIYFL